MLVFSEVSTEKAETPAVQAETVTENVEVTKEESKTADAKPVESKGN